MGSWEVGSLHCFPDADTTFPGSQTDAPGSTQTSSQNSCRKRTSFIVFSLGFGNRNNHQKRNTGGKRDGGRGGGICHGAMKIYNQHPVFLAVRSGHRSYYLCSYFRPVPGALGATPTRAQWPCPGLCPGWEKRP